MARIPSRPVVALLAGASLLLAACGGAATPSAAPATATAAPTAEPTPEPTPSPTPEPTPSPTPEPTPSPSPSPDLGGFAFPPADVIGYYEGIDFECGPASESTQAPGYTIIRCEKTAKKKPTAMITLAWTTGDEVTGYGYAGYYNKPGGKMPNKSDAFEHVGGFIGALLGPDDGVAVGEWVFSNFGDEIQDTYNDLTVYSYPANDEGGRGFFLEVLNEDFQAAIANP